jgi:ion channel
MRFLEAAAVCFALVLATVYVHYEGLSFISRQVARLSHGRTRVFYVVLGTLVAHFIEILLYALGYVLGESLGVGSISGPPLSSFRSVLYFSAETFTSLGFGDRFPTADLRLIAGIECLNGFILIGWSTSFTYLSMRNFWGEVPAVAPIDSSLSHPQPTRSMTRD